MEEPFCNGVETKYRHWPQGTASPRLPPSTRIGSGLQPDPATGPDPASPAMSLDQLKRFLGVMQDDAALRQQVLAAATADDVAQIGQRLGYTFSGDELLRLSGQKVGRVTVTKQDIPGEYN